MNIVIDTCGEFFELFDLDTKETLYVSDVKAKCEAELARIESLGLEFWKQTLGECEGD